MLPQIDSNITSIFTRHLVLLCCSYGHRDDAGNVTAGPFFACLGSGFVVRFQGRLFLLTAGHVLRKLESDAADPRIIIDGTHLADSFGNGVQSNIPIPISFRDIPKRWFYQEGGLDYGIALLSENAESLLRANGIVPFDAADWATSSSPDKFDHFVMVGVPEEDVSSMVRSDEFIRLGETAPYVVGKVHPLVMQVLRSPTDERDGRFVADIPTHFDNPSVTGMSGGPIVGFRDSEEGRRYFLVAIQSAWNPQMRWIFATPVSECADQLRVFMAELLDDEGRSV